MKIHLTLSMAGLLLAATAALITIVGIGALAPQRALASTNPSAPATLTARENQTGTAHTAAVVVQFDDRRSAVRAIDFTAPISGISALQQAGLDVTIGDTSFGPAVCAIQNAGCPADDCFCNPDQYWSYNYWDGTAWQAYPVGASTSVISATGAIEGWRWGATGSTQLPAPQAIAAANALAWLRSQQDPATGGYGDSAGGAVEVLMAIGANDERMADWRPQAGRRSLADFMRLNSTRYSRMGVAEAGKLAIGAVAAEGCRTLRSLQPSDYFSTTLDAFAPDSGFNAWAILGTVALSQSVPAGAVDALASQIQPGGGWEWQSGFGADTNTTSVAIQALLAAGRPVTSTEVVSGLAFLKSGQLADGGFVYDPANPQYGADANSTAYAVQALVAAGEDPAGEPWTVESKTPLSYLLSLQQPDGSFAWQPETGPNLLATAQAVPALLGRPYPIAIGDLGRCMRPGR